jgi:hypothetical protein
MTITIIAYGSAEVKTRSRGLKAFAGVAVGEQKRIYDVTDIFSDCRHI